MNRYILLSILPLLAMVACGDGIDERLSDVDSALSGITFVQVATGGTGNGSPTSATAKYAKAQNAGDANVVAICWNTSSDSVTSVTDSKGNGYSASPCPVVRLSGDASCTVYGAFGIAAAAAGANTVTVRFASGALDPDVRIAEYAGIVGFDACGGSTGSGTTASSGPVTTTASGDLLVGSDYVQSNTTGAGSGFTKRVISSQNSSILEDAVAAAPGSYSATASTDGGWWVMQMAAFKPATVADAGGPDASAEGGADGGSDGNEGGGSAVDVQSGDTGMEAGADGSADSAPDAGPDGGDEADAGQLSDATSDAGGGLDTGMDSPESDDSDVGETGSDAAVGAGGQDATLTEAGAEAGSDPYPLSLAPGNGYLLDSHGNPWFMQGDTAWSLEVQPSQADMLAYLNDRQSRGYNAVIMESQEHRFSTHSPIWADATGDVPFLQNVPGTGSLDFTTPNPAYWAYIDSILQAADQRGILILFFPDYLGYSCLAGPTGEGWAQTMGDNGTARMTTFGQFLGNRYKNQPNILWVNGGDCTPTGATLDEINAVANGIRAAGDTHLMTAHWGQPSGGTEMSAADISPIPSWLQIDDLYTYDDQTLYQKADRDYARDKGIRPEFLIESDYEGEHPGSATTPDTWRAEMYEPPLAGSMGFVFGNNPLWPFATAGDGNPSWALTTTDTGIFASWRTCLPSPGSQDGATAGAFFRSLPWWTLLPDTTNHVLLSSNNGVAAYTNDGRLAVVYLSEGSTGTINLSSFSGAVTAQWFDPRAGTYAPIAGSPFANTGSHAFAVPGHNASGQSDWVLLLQVSP